MLEKESTPGRAFSYAIKLRLTISALFMCLILPSFALVVYYIYKNNYAIYKENASAQITNHNNQMKDKLLALLDPISDSLLTMAKQVRDDPKLFDSASINDTMLLHLQNNPDLTSIFLASDKGSFHQVQKMREGMIVADRVPPNAANFNFWVVESSQQSSKIVKPSTSVFTFFKTRDAEPLDTFVIPNNYDPRERPFYKNLWTTVTKTPEALRQRFILLDEPYIAGSTSRATMTVSTPVYADDQFKGMLGESFELTAISSFLKSIQISKNSETYILDAEGGIVVSTGADNGYTIDKKMLIKQNVLNADGQAVQQAFKMYATGKTRQFEFTHAATSETYLAQFTEFPNSYNKKWDVRSLR
jgi:adenylate cyclase